MINNKKFLESFKEYYASYGINMNHIKNIRFNNKSISISIYNVNFFLNELYTENSLRNDIIRYLIKYLDENTDEYLIKPDEYISYEYLESKFQKINIRNIND